jgi:DinB family protein
VESREEEVARVRSYLASQSMRRTPAQLVETLNEAHQQFLAALALVPDVSFHLSPREGQWSAADVLLHVRSVAAYDASAIPAVIARGEQPTDIQDTILPAPPEMTRSGLLAELEASRERLTAVVLQADPEAHLEILWCHSEFGLSYVAPAVYEQISWEARSANDDMPLLDRTKD